MVPNSCGPKARAKSLFLSLSNAAKMDPRFFMEEISMTFGRGAIGIYESVSKRGALAPTVSPRPSDFEATISELQTAVVSRIPAAGSTGADQMIETADSGH